MQDVRTRFMAKIRVDGASGCWLWQACTTSDGYGQIKIAGKMRGAHRVAYELLLGEIPEGLVLDHLCRVRHCVNPDHLRAVTSRENTLAPGSLAPAKRLSARTRCLRGHLLVEPNLVPSHSRRGKRTCLACARARNFARARLTRYGESRDFGILVEGYYEEIMSATGVAA